MSQLTGILFRANSCWFLVHLYTFPKLPFPICSCTRYEATLYYKCSFFLLRLASMASTSTSGSEQMLLTKAWYFAIGLVQLLISMNSPSSCAGRVDLTSCLFLSMAQVYLSSLASAVQLSKFALILQSSLTSQNLNLSLLLTRTSRRSMAACPHTLTIASEVLSSKDKSVRRVQASLRCMKLLVEETIVLRCWRKQKFFISQLSQLISAMKCRKFSTAVLESWSAQDWILAISMSIPTPSSRRKFCRNSSFFRRLTNMLSTSFLQANRCRTVSRLVTVLSQLNYSMISFFSSPDFFRRNKMMITPLRTVMLQLFSKLLFNRGISERGPGRCFLSQRYVISKTQCSASGLHYLLAKFQNKEGSVRSRMASQRVRSLASQRYGSGLSNLCTCKSRRD